MPRNRTACVCFLVHKSLTRVIANPVSCFVDQPYDKKSDDMMLRTCDFSDIADKDPLLLFARALLCKEVVEVVLDGIVR